jgi:glutamyl-Q tRNA(Asp) synthetase
VEHALRLRTENRLIQFNDTIMGEYGHNPQRDIGDFIIRRRDGLFAYQLAVVVDDERQNITDIVRGYDLLDSTPRQIYLQQCLNYRSQTYAHLPLAVNKQGDKLSKQTAAAPIEKPRAPQRIIETLAFLGQQPPAELAHASIQTIWQWAIENWNIDLVPRRKHIPAQTFE